MNLHLMLDPLYNEHSTSVFGRKLQGTYNSSQWLIFYYVTETCV